MICLFVIYEHEISTCFVDIFIAIVPMSISGCLISNVGHIFIRWHGVFFFVYEKTAD